VYDVLRRQVAVRLRCMDRDVTVQRIVYGDSLSEPELRNARGQVIEVRDQSGILISEYYDFKGNLLRSKRQLAKEYKKTLDWGDNIHLDTEVFTTSIRYDALNRPVGDD
jgi:YD repeat-containing protein